VHSIFAFCVVKWPFSFFPLNRGAQFSQSSRSTAYITAISLTSLSDLFVQSMISNTFVKSLLTLLQPHVLTLLQLHSYLDKVYGNDKVIHLMWEISLNKVKYFCSFHSFFWTSVMCSLNITNPHISVWHLISCL
jgi:hypothetical protein